MKATGVVRRIDDLGRVVIPKEIRRTLRIREGDPPLITLTPIDRFLWAIHSVVERHKAITEWNYYVVFLRLSFVIHIFFKYRIVKL